MTSRSQGGGGVNHFVTTVLSLCNKTRDDGGRGGGSNIVKIAWRYLWTTPFLTHFTIQSLKITIPHKRGSGNLESAINVSLIILVVPEYKDAFKTGISDTEQCTLPQPI